MKNRFLFLVAILFSVASVAARADRPLVCASSDGKYQLTIDDFAHPDEATLLIDGKPVMFGDLRCRRLASSQDRLACSSHDVADAGYEAIIRSSEHGHEAELGEIWIGGVRPLGTLPCEW